MNFQAKLFIVIATIIMILSVIPPGASKNFPVCNHRKPAVWDDCTQCTTSRCTFKSISLCYPVDKNAMPVKYVNRYDYYTCSKVSTTYTLTRFNCTGAPVIICNSNDDKFDIFNRFNDGTKSCSLSPPEPATVCP